MSGRTNVTAQAATNAPVPGATFPPSPTATPAGPPAFPAFPAVNAAPGAAPTTPGAATIAPAEDPNAANVQIQFPNAPLEQVLTFYAELVGRTVIKSPTVPAASPITLKAQTSLTRKDAKEALDYVLAMNNITMVPMGEKFVLAVPSTQALQEGAAFTTVEGNQLPEAAQFVTQLVRVTNAIPSEVMPAIQPFAKLPGGITALDGSGLLVIRDYAVNVKRMLEIIKRIDVFTESDYKLEVIPIRYGKVEDIYGVMSGLIGGGGGAGGAPTARSTSARSGSGGRGGTGTARRSTRNSPGQMTPPGQATTQGAVNPVGNQSDFQRRLQGIITKAAGGDSQILGDAKILPDERNNSLVVYATKPDMIMITNLVNKLDVMLAQVLIEAVIIDVTVGDNLSFGVSYLQNPRTSGKLTTAGGINNGQSFLSGLTNNLSSGLPSGFSYFGKWAGDMEVAVTAIAGNSSGTVLQRPRIQTTHAVPATFFSGSKEPYSAGTTYGYSSYANSYVQYLDVGIGLTVTPFITPDGLVLMEISQTVDEFQGYVDVGGGQKAPRTTSREADSTVSVKSGETIILGGFIRTSKTSTKSGVPILKDIPLLGALFRSSSRDNTRNELIVMLRPTVMTNPQDAARVAQEEKEKLPGVRQAERDFQAAEEKILKKTNQKLDPKSKLKD